MRIFATPSMEVDLSLITKTRALHGTAVACVLHSFSPYNKPFVILNCIALASSLALTKTLIQRDQVLPHNVAMQLQPQS
jgi:hypothetical protein